MVPIGSLMLLDRLARHATLLLRAKHAIARTITTVTGKSGARYTRDEVLQRHRTDSALNIPEANFGDDDFVVKRVPRQFFDLSQRLAPDSKDSTRLRLHIDSNQEESVLVFTYSRSTLLALIQEDSDFPIEGRKRNLQQVGEAIQELHSKDWMHIGISSNVKPDNVLVNWDCNCKGHRIVTNAVLGDYNLAFRLKNGQPCNTPDAIGNAMWRSPEGQTGSGVTKASDIYSFGLVCIYAMGGADFLLLDDYQQLADRGITPEQEILTRHFCYFGPVPEAVLKIPGKAKWSAALKGAARMADEMVKDGPELRFEGWGEELGPEALQMISRMTAPDSKARLTIDQVMVHPFWPEDA